MNWSKVPQNVRDDLLKRRDGGEPVESLAKEIRMRSGTLSRRLREHAATFSSNDNEERNRVSYKEHGNIAEASVDKSPRVKTLDQLIDVCQIDLDEWRITDWGVKKWEVGAKLKKGYIQWQDGRIADGKLNYGGLGHEELWSVWAKLARKNPKPLLPIISPVTCKTTYRKIDNNRDSEVRRAMIIADTHFGFHRETPSGKLVPFHDRGVLDLALQIAESEQPDGIYMIGDFFDLAMWTDTFLRSPKYEYTTQPSINEGHWWLRQFRMSCPSSYIIIHEGNHDARMKRMVMKHLRAAYGLRPADELNLPPTLSPQRLLALHKLDVEWINNYPSDRTWLNPTLCLEHGDLVRKDGGATSKAHISTASHSIIFGHVHRKEMSSRVIYTSSGAKTVMAYSPGCSCRTDGAVPGYSKIQNWHQGIALIDYTEDDFAVHDIAIDNGKAIWSKKVYVARNAIDDLKEDMPEWHW